VGGDGATCQTQFMSLRRAKAPWENGRAVRWVHAVPVLGPEVQQTLLAVGPERLQGSSHSGTRQRGRGGQACLKLRRSLFLKPLA